MNIKINNTDFSFEDRLSLLLLVENQQLKNSKGIAIAVNNKVVPKNNWDNYELKDNDSVTIIRATQGG